MHALPHAAKPPGCCEERLGCAALTLRAKRLPSEMGFTIGDHFRNTACGKSHHRHAGGERFHYDAAHAFFLGGHYQQIELGKNRGNILTPAEKIHRQTHRQTSNTIRIAESPNRGEPQRVKRTLW